MKNSKILTLLTEDQRTIVLSIKKHTSLLLDNTHRFKFFTLHGSKHIDNLFRIVDILIEGGLLLSNDQAFLLSCAICTHDIGMVTPLSDLESISMFGGVPQPPDPSKLESYIRSIHHELVDNYVITHFDFLISIGLTPSQCSIIKEISKCHRKTPLTEKEGHIASIGALLRIIDELDLYPSRAPSSILLRDYKEMDATSCWHWFKHNICEEWMIGHNVTFDKKIFQTINFKIVVHPPREESIPYWLTQIRKPIYKELLDEGAGKIIMDNWGIQLNIQPHQELSSTSVLGDTWIEIEQKSLSAGRKVIIVIDDEVRKMEDLFLPLMQHYHVIFSPNAKDGLDKLNAAKVDLAIVDLQVGSGFTWSPEETSNFKMTGLKLCREILSKHNITKIGVLTGSRYDLTEVENIKGLKFLIKKPVDPDFFETEVCNVLNS